MTRVPDDAFELYASLGSERSYQRVADELGCSKRAIVDKSAAENGLPRLESIEEEARLRSEEKLKETLEEQRTRHLRTLRVVHGKAVEALRDHAFSSAAEATKAIETVIKMERLISGEPSQRAQIAVEETTRREIDALVRVKDIAEGEGKDADADPG
jgi:hypothetical protein